MKDNLFLNEEGETFIELLTELPLFENYQEVINIIIIIIIIAIIIAIIIIIRSCVITMRLFVHLSWAM
jgi:hypothetical protein